VTDNAEDCKTQGDAIHPQLIFLDVMLPGGVSGYELCRYFRDKAETTDAHIVIVTARTGPVVERTTARAGANELVYKPFRLDTIEGIIKRVLDGA
jgi:DNA-binding response OmpR family regulator